MIRREELSYNFIQKEPQSGSSDGMRFYLTKGAEGIEVYAYPDRFCFVKTPAEEKIMKVFENVPESMEAITEWLNEQLNSGRYEK